MKELANAGLIANPNSPTEAKRLSAIRIVRAKYLGALMLSGANRDKFTALRTDLTNWYGYLNNLYPNCINQCLSLLNRWAAASIRTPWAAATPSLATLKQDDKALVFAQGNYEKNKSKHNEEGSSKSSSSSLL